MANGKKFKDEAFTCATRIFPLNSTLKVTNIDSGVDVRVKVTDRIGKRFATKRIDLSKAAFAQIAELDKGLVKVKVEVID
jgi:rare lipoprotein A